MSVSLVNRLSAIDPPSPKPKKPPSAKKLAANRANSQKSTGPRTQEGKSKVAQNARKHNCSQSTLLPGECTATYEIHLNEIREELHPQTPLQYHLVSQISQIIWKLQRMADTEKELFALNTNDNEFPCQTLARSFHTNPTSNDFALFERYQRQLRTSWLRLHNQFRQLKKDPPPQYPDDEPKTLAEARRRIHETFIDPADPPDTHINLMSRLSPDTFPNSNPALQTTDNEPQTRDPIKPTNSPENPTPTPESPLPTEQFNQTNPPPTPIRRLSLPILTLLLFLSCLLLSNRETKLIPTPSTPSRRTLLKTAAISPFLILPRHVLGGAGFLPPSETITRATIGVGGQGFRSMLENKPNQPPQQLAVCDVDKNHLAKALAKTGPKCTGYDDFRKLLERKDIDTIHIATPDHWHSLLAIAAMEAGKDVLCEKPMTRFIREGPRMIAAAKRFNRILQIDTQGRRLWTRHRKLVESKLLGWPLTIYIGPQTNFEFKLKEWSGRIHLDPQPVPPELNYDLWLGPAPLKPYHPHRVHQSFRGYWDYAGGGLTDMGQHLIDPAQYILGKDETGPTTIEAIAPWPPHPDAAGLWNRLTLTYDDGCKIILESGEWGEALPGEQALITGPKGKVFGGKKGNQTDPPGLWKQIEKLPDPPKLLTFDEAVKTRMNDSTDHPNGPQAHRSATLLHLCNIAIRTGRKITWDPSQRNHPQRPSSQPIPRNPPEGPMALLDDNLDEILAALLESVPAKSPPEVYPKLERLLAAGADAIRKLADLLLEDGHGDDARVRFAFHGLAIFVGNNDAHRKIFADAVSTELETAAPNSVKMFLLQQLHIAGAAEAIPALEKLATDPDLGPESARILSSLRRL
jgi:myo-inositol 2-dehydrogenase/D-chiro-inositol 1-dehydrogenase